VGLLEGAPKPDPEFILPPDEPECIDTERMAEDYRRSGRTLKVACGAAAFMLVGSGILIATSLDNGPRRQAIATPTESTPLLPSATASESESPSPSATLSVSPTAAPSPTRTTASPTPKTYSPSHIPSPTATVSKSVSASPTPSPETSKPAPQGACTPNENAPGEIVCSEAVWAYSAPGGPQSFQIIGGAAVNCSKIETEFVEVSISNASGWSKLEELGNPC
jgi:hypothetical protein